MKMALITLILLILCVLAAPAPAQENVEQVIDSLMSEYEAAPDDAAKLSICLDVLGRYPESNYTVPLLGIAKDHSAALGKLDDFLLIAEKIRGQVTAEKMQGSIDRFLLETYGEAKHLEKLNVLAEKLTAGEEGNFNLFYDLIRAYTATEQWDRILAYTDQALPFANAEAYKNDFPDRKMTDDEIEERARNREGLLRTYSGWAKAHTGRIEQALEDFKFSDGITQRMYMGHTYGNLDHFWGVTLARAGKIDEALDRLAAKAIFGEDEDARKAMREAYAEKFGNDDQYDAFVEQQRMKLARKIDDFSLAQYTGEPLTLSSLQGKVILLSFWFPT
jgi:hypothetical protein